MIPINDFCELRDVTIYRLAKQTGIKEGTLRKRANELGWEMSYSDGVPKFKSPKKDGVITIEGVEL